MNCAVFLTYRVSTGRHFSEFIFDICCFYLRGFKQHKITYKNREENYFLVGQRPDLPSFGASEE